MNNFIENLKHHDLNIFKFLMVGNDVLGCAVISSLQKDVDGEFIGDVSIQVESHGRPLDLASSKRSETEYHVEVEDAVMDIIIGSSEVNIGFTYREESTIQSIKIKE